MVSGLNLASLLTALLLPTAAFSDLDHQWNLIGLRAFPQRLELIGECSTPPPPPSLLPPRGVVLHLPPSPGGGEEQNGVRLQSPAEWLFAVGGAKRTGFTQGGGRVE